MATVDVTLGVLLQGQLRAQRDAGFDVTTISAPGPWVPELEAAGVRHIPWRHATSGTRWRTSGRSARLFTILGRALRHRPHAHGEAGRDGPDRGTAPARARDREHGPWVRRQSRAPAPRRAFFMGLEWFAARFSDAELYQSGADLERARRLRMVAPSQSLLIGNGTDLHRFDPTAVNGRADEIRRELGIRLRRSWSGRSAASWPRRATESSSPRPVPSERGRPRSGSWRSATPTPRRRMRSTGTSSTPPARTWCSRAGATICRVLSVFDVFVLASWREGRASIRDRGGRDGQTPGALRHPGVPGVAREDVEAIFVPPRDAALTSAISTLVADPARADALGRNARARATDRFDEDRISRMTIARYERLLRRTRVPR